MQSYWFEPVADVDAVDFSQVLLVGAGFHVLRAAAIGDCNASRAQPFRLNSGIHGGHAAANDDNICSHRNFGEAFGGTFSTADIGNKVDSLAYPVELTLIAQAQCVDCGEADAQKYGIILLAQRVEVNICPELLAGAFSNTANAQYKLHFLLRKVVRSFVCGNAILIQAAKRVAGVKQRYAMA